MAYIVKQPIGGKIYVNLAENRHIVNVGPRQTRKYLGTIDAETGQLILGKNTAEPNSEVVRLLAGAGVPFGGMRKRRKGRRTSDWAKIEAGTGVDGVLHLQRPVETLGEVHLLGHIAESVGLCSVLIESFGSEVGKALLMLAMYQVCEARALYLAEDWMEGVSLAPELRKYDFSSPALSVLMAQLGADHRARERFICGWIMACGKPRAVIYDMTSLSTYSPELDLAEYGYNRDGDSLPQVNLALVASATNRLPLA